MLCHILHKGANASLDPICFIETPEGKVYVLSNNQNIDFVRRMFAG